MLGGKALLQDKKTGTVTAKQGGPMTSYCKPQKSTLGKQKQK